jgi:hypothetical protein
MSDVVEKDTGYADEKGQEFQSEMATSEKQVDEKSLEETKLVRKLDVRILPIACLLYLFACKPGPFFIGHFDTDRHADLDRTNLGNARLQGLPEDTLHGDPTGHLFDWVNSAFFFSYVS